LFGSDEIRVGDAQEREPSVFPLLFIKPPDKRGELPYNLK